MKYFNFIIFLAVGISCDPGANFSGSSTNKKSPSQPVDQIQPVDNFRTQNYDASANQVTPLNPVIGTPQVVAVEDCLSSDANFKELAKELTFPTSKGCTWSNGQDGNTFSGYNVQTESIAIPTGSTLCEISEVKSLTDTIEYDDYMFLLIDDYLVAGQAMPFLSKLEKKSDLVFWDWNKIVGTSWGSDSMYCFGTDSTCVFPGHSDTGRIEINLGSTSMHRLAKEVEGKTKIDFNLVGTGDDNSEDCYHSELKLSVKLKYIEP